MGRYMGKTKRTGHVAGMDLSLGVRTRAKTLALLRLQQQQTSPKLHASAFSCPPPAPSDTATSAGYLQLRSRRLEKPPVVLYGSNRRQTREAEAEAEADADADAVVVVDHVPGGNPNPNPNPVLESDSVGLRDRKCTSEKIGESKPEEDVQQPNVVNGQVNDSRDLAADASIGDNCLDSEARDRSSRESTPGNLIREPEVRKTHGSTTQPTCSTNGETRMQNSVTRRIPTAGEMDEFFAGAEGEQVKQFINKYNFDPINEKPLPPGRYEWEKLDL